MEQVVIYLLLAQKLLNLKQKNSEIVANPLCLGNVSKGFSVDSMKKTRLNRYVYNFTVGYDAIAVDDILDIYKYLIKKNSII